MKKTVWCVDCQTFIPESEIDKGKHRGHKIICEEIKENK